MKRLLLTLALVCCTILLLSVAQTPTLSSQDDKKLIRKPSNKDAPVEIMQVKLSGRPLETDQPFDAHDDWVKGVSVELKNVSKKEIIYVKVELDFPTDDSESNLVVIPLEYGRPPQDGEPPPPESEPLRPGERVTVAVPDWGVEFLKRKLAEKGHGRAVKMGRAVLFVSQVWFDANTVWAVGGTFERDPSDRHKWKPAAP